MLISIFLILLPPTHLNVYVFYRVLMIIRDLQTSNVISAE